MKKLLYIGLFIFGFCYNGICQLTEKQITEAAKKEIAEDKISTSAEKEAILKRAIAAFRKGDDKKLFANSNLGSAANIFETPMLANPCVNADFEYTDTTDFLNFGWLGFGAATYSTSPLGAGGTGFVPNNLTSGLFPSTISPGFKHQTTTTLPAAFGSLAPSFGGSYHKIESAGPSPIPGLSKSISGKSLRLGNDLAYNGAEIISKSFIVPVAMNKFRFKYALVANPDNGAPGFFNAKVVNQFGVVVDEITDIAQSSNPFFLYNSLPPFYYRPWHIAELDLSSLIGQKATIIITNSDCFGYGHNQYVYLDDFCTTEKDTKEGYIELNAVDSCNKLPITFSGNFSLSNIPGNPPSGATIKISFYQSGVLVCSKSMPAPLGPAFSLTMSNSDCPSLTGCVDVVAELSFKIKDINGILQTVTKVSGNVNSGFRPGQNNDVCLNCAPPCDCGDWGSIGYSINNKIDKFLCGNGTGIVLTANSGDMFSLNPRYTCVGSTDSVACQASFKFDIYYPNDGMQLGVTSIQQMKLDSCGRIRIVMTPYCNGKPCNPCEFTIVVNCCNCNPDLTPMLSWQTAKSVDSLKLNCGETYTNKLDCFKDYNISVKNPCGTDCKPDSVKTTITYPNGTSAISYSVFGTTLSTGSLTGTFTVSIKVKCNGVWCKECKLTFIQTKACPPPCVNCKDKVQAGFNSGASNVNVQTFPAASTLNANLLLSGGADTYTQVRVNVADIQVTSDNPACLQCYNTPNQWGSITGGSLTGFTATSSTYGSIPVNNAYNNSREIVFNAATATGIPMPTALALQLQIPGVNPLSCCCINVKIFIKITYRNNKCEECSKTVLIDLTECPENGGTATFNLTGHPQFRVSSPDKSAEKLVDFTGEKMNK